MVQVRARPPPRLPQLSPRLGAYPLKSVNRISGRSCTYLTPGFLPFPSMRNTAPHTCEQGPASAWSAVQQGLGFSCPAGLAITRHICVGHTRPTKPDQAGLPGMTCLSSILAGLKVQPGQLLTELHGQVEAAGLLHQQHGVVFGWLDVPIPKHHHLRCLSA